MADGSGTPSTPDDGIAEARRLFNAGETGSAVDILRRAIITQRRAAKQSPLSVARLQVMLARMFEKLGADVKAESAIKRALPVLMEAGDVRSQAEAYGALGTLHWKSGKTASAAQSYRDAIDAWKRCGGTQAIELSRAWRNLGIVQRELGQANESITSLDMALAIHPGPDNDPLRLEILLSLANSNQDAGRFRRAWALYDAVEPAIRNQPEHHLRLLNSRAMLSERLGDLQGAANAYRMAMLLLDRTAKRRGKAISAEDAELTPLFTNAATLFAELGDLPSALRLLRRARRIGQRSRLAHISIMVMGASGDIAELQGRLDVALRHRRRLFQHLVAVVGRQHPYTLTVAGMLADLLHRQGKTSTAVRELRRAIDDLPADAPLYEVTTLRLYLCGLLVATGTLTDSRFLRRAFADGLRLGAPDLCWRLLAQLARFEENRGAFTSAILLGKAAVSTVQSMAATLGEFEPRAKNAFWKLRSEIHPPLVSWLIAAGRLPESERVRQMEREAVLFALAHGDAATDPRVTPIPLTRAEAHFFERLDRLAEDAQACEADTGRLFASVDRWLDDAAGQPDVSDRTAMDAGARPPPGVGDLRFVVSPTGVVLSVSTDQVEETRLLDIDICDINRRVAAFRNAIFQHDRDLPALGHHLYEALIAPVAGHLEPDAVVRVFADGALRYLPFAALNDGTGYLIERWPIVHGNGMPLAGERSQKDRRAWRLGVFGADSAAVGHAPLDHVAPELSSIAALFTENATTNATADAVFTKDHLAKTLRDGLEVVHIAGHFVMVPGRIDDSFLLLGNGDHLSLGELRSPTYDFSSVEVVVLSSCASGVADDGADGLDSLASLVQAKGARSVLATLWPVADVHTARFMEGFYSRAFNRTKPGTLAEAVRSAQRASADRLWGRRPGSGLGNAAASPAHWAGFCLYGDWR